MKPTDDTFRIPTVPPAPLPFSTTVVHERRPLQTERGMEMHGFVLLFHSTPAGMAVAVWTAEDAERIAKEILKHAWQAKTNIEIPQGGGDAGRES